MSTTRPRGFAPWHPHAATLTLLDQVAEVLDEYREHLPLTIRQIFYRLVGTRNYAKTENAYDRLCETMNRARRAGLIPFASIRDDGTTWAEPDGWASAASFIEAVISTARGFRFDRQEGQPVRLLLAVEAAGMVPQMQRIAAPFGIPVYSSGGFDSVTAKYDLAQRLQQYSAAEVLHIGDHDPSGVHLFRSMAEDVRAFAGLDIRFSRLAVTPEQIVSLGLPTAPAKPTDRREFDGETTQAEAIAPDVLADLVREAIEDRMDRDAYDTVLRREVATRASLPPDTNSASSFAAAKASGGSEMPAGADAPLGPVAGERESA